MMKKITSIILIAIIVVFALQLNTQAAVIVSTDKQVQSGSGTVTISVSSRQALGSYVLEVIDTAGLSLTGANGRNRNRKGL